MRARRRGEGFVLFFSAAIVVALLFVVADAQQPSSSSPLAKLPGALVERAAKTLRDGPTSVTNFARFNDTLVSLAGDDGIPFATYYEPTTGEECAALCASVTAKASAAAAKKKKGDAAPPLPRCFSAAFDAKEEGDEKDGKGTYFTCALYGWATGNPCPDVTIETSGGTTSFLDPKALSSSLGACAAAGAAASSVSSSATASSATASSSPATAEATKSKKKAAAASSSFSLALSGETASKEEKKADALGAIAAAVRSSLPPAPPDPAAAASAASAAAASLASAASGGDDTAARAQAWAAVVDAKPGAAVAVVGARPPISLKRPKSDSKNLTLSFEYLGTVTDVASAAVCSGLCQQFVAGADNAGGGILGVTKFGADTVSGTAGYYGVSDGPLQAHCVAASFYDGDAALGVDPSTDPDQSVGKVCDLFGVAPRGPTVLLLEPEASSKNGKELARSTVTFVRPQRWSELDYALEE